jgi:hypothetical protein
MWFSISQRFLLLGVNDVDDVEVEPGLPLRHLLLH